jgi:hypothetical protein
MQMRADLSLIFPKVMSSFDVIGRMAPVPENELPRRALGTGAEYKETAAKAVFTAARPDGTLYTRQNRMQRLVAMMTVRSGYDARRPQLTR